MQKFILSVFILYVASNGVALAAPPAVKDTLPPCDSSAATSKPPCNSDSDSIKIPPKSPDSQGVIVPPEIPAQGLPNREKPQQQDHNQPALKDPALKPKN